MFRHIDHVADAALPKHCPEPDSSISSNRPALRRPVDRSLREARSPRYRRQHRTTIIPHISSPGRTPSRDFFLSGGLTRTSSSAVISGLLNRTVPSRSDLRRTPVQQGFAAFVTGSATRRGTR
ncbi:hypothetical protein D7207_28905 [Burkholderia cepacia]|nr:hypothetical protein [Burkholderia cepacia]MBA9947641.1 hypothetical protein [Burkholderia cepacia]MBA9977827.1 hypothetical protein [Burkholderia cepacia]MBA9997289.1 hypothetical protein [Burkholderia cepacia]MBB0004381.1 hypothetical protein [Burkholderia cepacia]